MPDTGSTTTSVTVPAERVRAWLAGFARSHGDPTLTADGEATVATAPDGARARFTSGWGRCATTSDNSLVDHFLVPRRVAIVVVRKGAHAIGLFDHTSLQQSRVDTHYVQGRTKAGGWSQQRYARRRQHQAEHAWAKAADDIARLVLPALAHLDAVVTAGDATALTTVWTDPRLAEVAARRSPHPVLPCPEPRQASLIAVLALARSATVALNDQARRRPL